MKDILEVIVYMPNYHTSEVYLFVSDEAFIEWWKYKYTPDAKNLRVLWVRGRGTLLNWNTPQLDYHSYLTRRMVKA